MDSIKAEWNVLIDSCALLIMAGRSNMTSSSGFTFLIRPLKITETDLQQSLCTYTFVLWRKPAKSWKGRARGEYLERSSIWPYQSLKVTVWAFAFLFCWSVCVLCVCIYWDHSNKYFPPSWGWNPATLQQMLSASFYEVRSSFTMLFSGFTLSVKSCSTLFCCYLLHVCMALKIAVNNKLNYFSRNKLRTPRRVWVERKSLHFISLSFTVHKRTQCHNKVVKNLDIYFSAYPDLISALKRTTPLT